MSMFDMIFGGPGPLTPVVALLLGQQDFSWYGRLRTAWIEKDKEGKTRLVVYTRNGGVNSEYNENIRKHPLYISDHDDTFDSTYNTAYFRVPENPNEIMWNDGCPREINIDMMTANEPINMGEEWDKALSAIKNGVTKKEVN